MFVLKDLGAADPIIMDRIPTMMIALTCIDQIRKSAWKQKIEHEWIWMTMVHRSRRTKIQNVFIWSRPAAGNPPHGMVPPGQARARFSWYLQHFGAKPSHMRAICSMFDAPPFFSQFIRVRAAFQNSLGCLLILIGLKFPIARKAFWEEYSKVRMTDEAKRVWTALRNTALRFTDGSSSCAVLRSQIDDIKGPLKIHGLSVYLQKLHVVQLGGSLKLGAGAQLFRVLPKLSLVARRAIQGFLNMHQTLNSLPQVASLASYKQAQTLVLKALSEHAVCQLKSTAKNSQYNREWSFRVLALARARTAGIQRLHYSKEGIVCV